MKTESAESFQILESRKQSSAEQPGNEITMSIATVDVVKNRLLCSLGSLLTFSDGFSSSLACDPSCKSCGPNSPRCLSCAEKAVLHDGKCISACPGGYYTDATGRCKGETRAITIIVINNTDICMLLTWEFACMMGNCQMKRNGFFIREPTCYLV